jgi:hypothetical protein
MNPSRRQLALALALSGLPMSFARAENVPAPVAGLSPSPRLTGQAVLRFFGLRVYDARLWVGADGPADLFERELFLELRYGLSLKGDRIAARSVDEMAGIGQGTQAQRLAWGEAMRRLFPDVSSGDRILGQYSPRGPSRFFYNDRPLGTIEDPDFGRAFFGIWLDPRTSEPAMRESLLRGLSG